MSHQELEVLKQAIMNEEEGVAFYSMAAEEAQNAEAREALSDLANEERLHKKWLQEMYERVEADRTGDFDFSVVYTPSPGVFRWENVPRSNISKALSVFSVGVKMEQSSIEFYKQAKNKVNSPAVEKLLDILIEWEQKHLDEFQKEYDALREEWWEQQRFSPS